MEYGQMVLVVFDIDGTLVNTNKVDGECYLAALEKSFGIPAMEPDWDAFPDATDSGILRDLFTTHFHRSPDDREKQLFIEIFVNLLEDAFAKAPERFKEIPGARALLEKLSGSKEYIVALATGGWGASAEFKLRCAKMDMHAYPFASANDGYSRADIVNTAIQKALARHKVSDFSRIVLVGDGSWDIRTARELEYPFIGVGDETFFRSKGVIHSVTDYLDRDGFTGLLHRASLPGPQKGK